MAEILIKTPESRLHSGPALKICVNSTFSHSKESSMQKAAEKTTDHLNYTTEYLRPPISPLLEIGDKSTFILSSRRSYEHRKASSFLSEEQRPFGPFHKPIFIPPKVNQDTSEPGLEDYLIEHEIGRGAYAVVKRVCSVTTGKYLAAKIYTQSSLADPLRRRSVEMEVDILKRLDHPGIIKLYDTIETKQHLYLIMELASGTSLTKFIRRKPGQKLDPAEAKAIFTGVVDALEYCHSQHIAHRDIKMENILVDQGLNVKLLDFGFATLAQSKTRMYCGTIHYMAPEIVNRIEYDGPAADIWACGVLLHVLLVGSYPFKAVFDKEVLHRIQKLIFQVPFEVETSARSLIKWMMEGNPSKRPTATEILEHPWLNEPSLELSCEFQRVKNSEGEYSFRRIYL